MGDSLPAKAWYSTHTTAQKTVVGAGGLSVSRLSEIANRPDRLTPQSRKIRQSRLRWVCATKAESHKT